jgi:phosphopantothenoylcysteine decarboxylase/phosphopantothenate--cysteine ligase
MDRAVMDHAGQCQIIIMAAAVSDFRPSEVSDRKIKKNIAPLQITLEPTMDILQKLGENKEGRILVGFAAETEALIPNSREKLGRKNLDLIIANDINLRGSGFAVDTNKVTMIDRAGIIDELPSMTKTQLAVSIIDKVIELKKNQGL